MSQEICAVPFQTKFDLKCELNDYEKVHGSLTYAGSSVTTLSKIELLDRAGCGQDVMEVPGFKDRHSF